MQSSLLQQLVGLRSKTDVKEVVQGAADKTTNLVKATMNLSTVSGEFIAMCQLFCHRPQRSRELCVKTRAANIVNYLLKYFIYFMEKYGQVHEKPVEACKLNDSHIVMDRKVPTKVPGEHIC